MEHLAREYRRSENLLLVSYQIRKGSELLEGQGYCIEAEDTRAVLIENDQFQVIDSDEFVVEEVIPEPTEKRFFYLNQQFTQIPADSLNRLLAGKLITQLEVHSDEPFVTHYQNQSTQQRAFKEQFFKGISFNQERDSLFSQSNSDLFVYEPNPRIPILRQRLQSLRHDNIVKTRDWENHRQYLSRLQDQLDQASDVIQREKLFDLLQEARKVKPPSINYAKELEWETEMRELQKAELLKNKDRRMKLVEKALEKAHGKGLTGWFTWVELENPRLMLNGPRR